MVDSVTDVLEIKLNTSHAKTHMLILFRHLPSLSSKNYLYLA